MNRTTDPRATLTTAGAPPTDAGPVAALAVFEFDTLAAQDTTERGGRTWYVRGQNLVIAHSQLSDGDTLTRTAADQQHDYVIIVPEGTGIDITAGAERATLTEPGVVIVPPGDSAVTALGGGGLFRVFDVHATDLLARCVNADSYAEPHPRVAPLVPWPDPPAGHRLRVYRNADYPREQGRFGRLFRTSTLMVNYGDGSDGPRNTNRMSPHHHDDFEQCSLTVAGDYFHHVRTPWTQRLDDWRDDQHPRVSSPSVTVIPPPTVHTSQAVGEGRHLLIDVFSPPRADFSAKPGWVLNADEYPAPDSLDA